MLLLIPMLLAMTAATPTPAGAIHYVQTFGSFGLIMYMMWRLQSHTVPNLTEENRKAQEQQRKDFKEMLNAQLGKFDEMQKAQMEFFRSQIEREQDSHERHTESLISELGSMRVSCSKAMNP